MLAEQVPNANLNEHFAIAEESIKRWSRLPCEEAFQNLLAVEERPPPRHHQGAKL